MLLRNKRRCVSLLQVQLPPRNPDRRLERLCCRQPRPRSSKTSGPRCIFDNRPRRRRHVRCSGNPSQVVFWEEHVCLSSGSPSPRGYSLFLPGQPVITVLGRPPRPDLSRTCQDGFSTLPENGPICERRISVVGRVGRRQSIPVLRSVGFLFRYGSFGSACMNPSPLRTLTMEAMSFGDIGGDDLEFA